MYLSSGTSGGPFAVAGGRLLTLARYTGRPSVARQRQAKYPNIIREHLHLGLSVTFDGFIGGLVTGNGIKIPHCCVILLYENKNVSLLFSSYVNVGGFWNSKLRFYENRSRSRQVKCKKVF